MLKMSFLSKVKVKTPSSAFSFSNNSPSLESVIFMLTMPAGTSSMEYSPEIVVSALASSRMHF